VYKGVIRGQQPTFNIAMNPTILRIITAILLFTQLSFSPAFGESQVIKGGVQRNNVIQEKEQQSGTAEAAPLEGKTDSTAPLDAAVDEQAPLDGQISKELRDKSFQLQNSQSSAQLDAEQQSTLQGKAKGGEEIYGCLGALLNLFNGAILKVFPQSDLNRFDVQPGDRIIGVNGHRYDFRTIIKDMVGTPGTIIELDIRTKDRVERHLQVRRTDARLLPQTGMYKQLTQRNRYW